MIGGGVNVWSNWNNIDNAGDFIGFFSIGAASSALMSWVGVHAGFIQGFVTGAALGVASNVIQGSLNELVMGVPFNIDSKSMLIQAGLSGIAGGIAGGFQARLNNKNFWTGKGGPKIPSEQVYTTVKGYEESRTLSSNEIGEIGELQTMSDFRAEGGEVIGRHVAYRVEGVKGYGITDVVGKKNGMLHIIESKNGQYPKFTNFQKMAFPKLKEGAKIDFFGPKAKKLNLPTKPISVYNFEIRRYNQYTYPK